MNLKELKARIDFLIEAYPDTENLKVVITTKGNSMCGREYTNIKSIDRGFDWEHNQIRIDPEDNLWKGNWVERNEV